MFDMETTVAVGNSRVAERLWCSSADLRGESFVRRDTVEFDHELAKEILPEDS